MTLEVGYWNLRGLVGFIRLIDVYTGENIKWVNYEVAEYDKWLEEKSKNEAGFGKIVIVFELLMMSKIREKTKCF